MNFEKLGREMFLCTYLVRQCGGLLGGCHVGCNAWVISPCGLCAECCAAHHGVWSS